MHEHTAAAKRQNQKESTQVQLRKVGLRVTPLRIALLAFLHTQEVPVDVQTCVQALTHQNVTFDQVTVYRNLEHFENKGLIKKVDVRDGRYYYEITDVCSHLICENCGTVSHFHMDELDEITKVVTKKINKKTKFKVRIPATDFFGTCGKCQ